MRIGRNMKAYLTYIKSEPGQWTAPGLAREFGVADSSVRRSLRKLESLGLIKPQSAHCDSCGQMVVRWLPQGK